MAAPPDGEAGDGAMRRGKPEFAFQKTVMQWLAIALMPPAFAVAIDHAQPSRITGALRKAAGVPSGLADVWVFSRYGDISTASQVVCLELKSMTGRLSDAQIAMAARLAKCGVFTFTCKTLEQVESALLNRNVPLRQRLEPRAIAQARGIA